MQDFGSKKLDVIKYVREATGYSLKEVKEVVESRGTIKGLPIEAAEGLVSTLNSIGASAEMKQLITRCLYE
ncbi:MAG: ribosomal protein L7/L12 [Ruminococcaceae bacterium]|nr:ribosomal protein L7/L12 [Oscillospiraceae bacterium]